RTIDRRYHSHAIFVAGSPRRRVTVSIFLAPSLFLLRDRFGLHRPVRAARVDRGSAGGADRRDVRGFARSLRRSQVLTEKHDGDTDDQSYSDNQPELGVIGHAQGLPFLT